jgi:hypothetical protein
MIVEGLSVINKCFADDCTNEAVTEFCPECLANGGMKMIKRKPNKQSLIKTFNAARARNSSFVFVGVEAEGIKEVITVPKQSFDAKEQFYMNAYSEELVHVMNSKVRVFGLNYGEAEDVHDLFR